MLVRKENWPQLLHQFIKDKKDSVFVWGANDCYALIIEWVEICTGINVDITKSVGKYKDLCQAIKRIRKFNDSSLSAIEDIAKHFGLQMIPATKMQRGDIALLKSNEEIIYCGGICIGKYIMAFDGDTQKLNFCDLRKAEFAWRV